MAPVTFTPAVIPLAILPDKKEFAEVVKVKLKYGDYPGLSRWAQCNHKGPSKRDRGGLGVEEAM